jgi:putative spermidine/putrescine transport system permease protein
MAAPTAAPPRPPTHDPVAYEAPSALRVKAEEALRRSWAILLVTLVLGVLVFLVAPIFIVVVVSFSDVAYLRFPVESYSLRWYDSFFGQRAWIDALWTGLRVAGMSAALSTVLGTMGAWGLARSRFRGKQLVYAFLFSPIIVPLIILALAVYFVFNDLRLLGSELGIVLAYTVMGMPYVVVTVSSALVLFDATQEQAASTLGASSLRTLWHVTFPQIASSIFAGGLFAFVIALDEVILITFLSGGRVTTLARRLWDSLRYDLDPSLAVAGSLLIFVTLGLFLAVEIARAVAKRVRTGQQRGPAPLG